ncbi:hypothetical protein METBIDRAFT_76926 [Metschnikowia bicuspidata var. bicuspidata NRRL YB-4993]|uniref:Cysteine dioxygenase n=1 Tax=Metschnikowia bicuspidata var. bicuspidata NRRL YB-4993 TaxID=869754 RepID=A0A1A0HJ40_9ASCO|nr:hypothetical protein METBIDRAFT_76926 [Metschnikowia bicuspidata var. bicuspidata NRRL YB-4993]OBA24030.1 hypothetical protein METBIDRAFT_76926 [Metschnikowia bicuspidata var. bicuspidata NRRL YB-4993]
MLSVNSAGSSDMKSSMMCTAPSAPQSREATVPTFGCLEDETNNDLKLDNKFGQLIDSLRAVLGTKGLACADVDVGEIRRLMERYQSDETEWGKFALSDASKGYTRNGVVNINGNANLLVLVWSPGKGSAIHDHANAHCCMKVLKGLLTESLYDVPETAGHAMVPRQITELRRDEVGYMSDDIGLHKISNTSAEDFAVSLHLYTPPYASLYGCSMYESGTLRKHHVNMSKYYSWQGTVLNQNGGSSC